MRYMTGRTRGRGLAAIVATAALALVLGACGGGSSIEGGGGKTAGTTVAVRARPSGNATISNWPLYIDRATVKDFERDTGVSVKYVEDVNDNAEFFGKMQPLLARGQSGGRSLFVVTDWMANKMHELGYLQEFDKAPLRAFEANLITGLQNPAFDPRRSYSAPWQSGLTGIIVRKDLAPDVRSVCDLFDSRYKGKVTMLTEMRDSVGLTMLGMGKDPTTGTLDDMLAAVAKIDKYVKNGQIRRFTGNDYLKDLPHGDSWIVYGWSGDAVQLQSDNKNIQFVHPQEGFML